MDAFNQGKTLDFKDAALKGAKFEDMGDFVKTFFKMCVDLLGFNAALDILLIRLRDTPFLSLYRNTQVNGMAVGPDARLPATLEEFLTNEIQPYVNQCIPCSATKTFECAQNGIITAHCCNSATGHVSHTSDQYYRKKRYEVSLFAWLNPDRFENVQCRWDGEYEPAEVNAIPNLVDVVESTLHKFTSREDIISNHHRTLVEFFRILQNPDVGSSTKSSLLYYDQSGCIACLLSCPTEKLQCGHLLCAACWELMMSKKPSNCPICQNESSMTDERIPGKAGYRVLSLDGGGVHGIVEVLVLEAIERKVGFPIDRLVDYIIGTSIGGIVALALTMSRNRGATNCRSLVEHAIREAFKYQYSSFWWWLFNERKYYKSSPLSAFLTQEFGDKSSLLFGGASSHPKVAVISCLANVTSKELPTVLLTSYNRAMVPSAKEDAATDPFYLLKPTTNLTIVDAALATFAAPYYFHPHFVGSQLFVDAVRRNNCPAEIGLQETARLWPDRKLDFILSVGTGNLETSTETAAETATEKIWGRVHGQEPDKSARINPTIECVAVAFDDTSKLLDLIRGAEKFLSTPAGKQQVNDVCERLFALLFYMDDVTKVDGALTFKIKSRERLNTMQQGFVKSFQLAVTYNEQRVEWSATPLWNESGFLEILGSIEISVIFPLNVCCTAKVVMEQKQKDSGRDISTSGCPFNMQ